MLTTLVRRLRTLLHRDRLESEMQEEMTAHLDLAVERLRARGMSEEEARRTSRREFGNLPSLQEEAREARGVLWIESLLADVRFAFRTFRRTPLATATIVIILALGLGVNTALFTLFHSILTLPAPGIPRDDSLFRIRRYQVDPNPAQYRSEIYTTGLFHTEMQEYAGRTDLFRTVAGWRPGGRQILSLGPEGDNLIQAGLEYATENYFDVLGVELARGAGFPPGASNSPDSPVSVAVIDHTLWDRYLGQDPTILGRSIRIGGFSFTVVGVAPPRFKGVDGRLPEEPLLWLPLGAIALLEAGSSGLSRNDYPMFSAVARLQEGVDPARIPAILQPIARRAIEASSREWRGEAHVDAVLLTASNREVEPVISGTYIPSVGEVNTLPALTSTFLILAIICMNVGALLASLALTRQREIVVRLALGASRMRIVRQLLTEGALRAVAGGMLGALIVWLLIPILRDFIPGMSLAVSWEVLLATFGFALATGILLGLLPALHATRISVSDSLKSSSASLVGRRSKLPQIFVVAQIVLTQPLIVGISIGFIGGIAEWDRIPGSEVDDRIVLTNFSLPGDFELDRLIALRERFYEVPWIVNSAFRRGAVTRQLSVHPEDQIEGVSPDSVLSFRSSYASPGYFEVMNLPIVLGRDFLDAERDSLSASSSVILSQEVAEALWGEANPVGRRFLESNTEGNTAEEVVVVGIVDEDTMAYDSRGGWSGSRISLYAPSPAYVSGELLIRTTEAAGPLLPALRGLILEEVPDRTFDELKTLAQIREEAYFEVYLAVGAMAGAVALGLFLSGIGLHGVISVMVGLRTREVGIRTVMGSTPAGVRRLILREAVWLGSLGLVLGVPLGLAVIDIMSPGDDMPRWTYLPAAIVTAILVLGTALLASWLPARRAASVDPMIVLRSE